MANTKQDQIVQKYEPAFRAIEREQVRITETRMQGDKLYVLAYAPSQEAKNKVWDQIKAVDPSYSDLTCDIRLGAPEPGEEEAQKAISSASPAALAQGLKVAFKSDRTPPFGEMVSHLFGHSSGEQKAGFLNQLLSITPGGLADEVLGMFGGKRQLTPEEAQQVPPEKVQQLAAKAHDQDPSVVDHVSEFYSQHPSVVKTLGVGTLTAAVSHMVRGMRGKSGGGGA